MPMFTRTGTVPLMQMLRRNRITASDNKSHTETVIENLSLNSKLVNNESDYKPEARIYMESYARTVEKLAEYFEQMYNDHVSKYGKVESKVKQCDVLCTPFHAALVRADQELIKDVMTRISNPDVQRFTVNALISYNSESTFNCSEIFQAQIAHLPEKHKETFLALEAKVKLTGSTYKHPYPRLHMQLPLALAALSGEFEMVKLVLSYDANLYATDIDGNNIIHNLVFMATEHPTAAVQILKDLQQSFSGVQSNQMLGMAVNNEGLKPLDLAARIGAVPIILPLLRWDGVYRFSLKECGPFQHVMYDVSDYELGRRMHVLQYLAMCPECDLHKIDDVNMMNTEPVRTWVNAINEMHRPEARVWAFIWAVFLLLFIGNGAYYFNSGGKHPPIWLSITLTTFACGEIVAEVYTIIRDRSIYKLMYVVSKLKGGPVAFTPIYRIFQGLFCITLITTEVFLLFDFDCVKTHTIFSALNVFNIIWAFCSMLIFIQLNKATGHLLIVMESMVAKAALFLTVGGVIFCIFPLSLHILHTVPACIQGNSTTPNDDEFLFDSVATSFYETILLALGIAAPNPLYFDNALIPLFAVITYIVAIFIVGIVMMNLLIAIMTDRVSELNRHKDTIQAIQRLSLSLLLNRGVSSSIIRFLSPFSFIHNRVRKRFYVQNAEKSQVFLHVIEMVGRKDIKKQIFNDYELQNV